MHRFVSTAVLSLLVAASTASAATKFTEGFDSGNAFWTQSVNANPATLVSTGGPNGAGDAYVTGTFAMPLDRNNLFPVAMRATGSSNGGVGASGGAFKGSYATIPTISVWVKQDYSSPLPISLRLGGSAGVGMAIASGQYVQPNTWTQLTFDLSAANPRIISFEGTPGGTTAIKFNNAIANVSNFQLFVDYTDYEANNSAFGVLPSSTLVAYGVNPADKFVPPATATTINISVDAVALIPEPASLGLAAGFLPLLARRRR